MITNHPIKNLILESIVHGLQRKAVKSCSRWASMYRVMGTPFPGKFNFKYFPWLLEMHDAEEGTVIGQKAAQMGYTEWAMNTAFYMMDVEGLDVLYVLPTASDASDFSAGRFDPALELSPHLSSFFAEVNNVGLKRAGSSILYVRGSHARSKLKSIPCAVLIFDEVDEMPEASVALAKERQSGQVRQYTRKLSTPTIEDYGINRDFKLSSEEYFHFRCPSCNKFTMLTFPDCLEITGDSLTDPNLKDSYLKCKECQTKLPVIKEETGANFKPWLQAKEMGGTAHFVHSHGQRDDRGFHVSQLYSMSASGDPANLAYAALRGETDEHYAQEWWNSKLGLPYVAKGAKVTDEQINTCIKGYKKGEFHPEYVRTMGIDVGSVLHIVVKEYRPFETYVPGVGINDQYRARLIYEGTSSGRPDDFGEALDLFTEFRCGAAVVDAEPERRAALQFAQSLWGYVYLCDYLYSQQGREVQYNEEEVTIKANRTSWLDLTLGRYKRGLIDLPINTSFDFKKQIKEPTRVFKQDKFGQPYAVYVNVGADHFAHADCYSELALPLALGLGQTQDIRGRY